VADKCPTLSGGGLCDEDEASGCVFKLERLAFNHKRTEGSASKGGKEFPIETHMIFYNQK
jgi:hypothetical protein